MQPRTYFEPDGPIAKALDGYEPRVGQMDMARAVAEALAEDRHLMAEAGTGVGKSFAYLLPAVLHAQESGTAVVVSTHTISLQEQLTRKDLPFLADVLPHPFRAVLIKGRGNYVCVRRLAAAVREETPLFGNLDEVDEFRRISTWAQSTRDGSRSDLPFSPKPAVWGLVQSESSTCPGAKCEHARHCFYLAARRRIQGADLLVVNHSLLLSDLVIRQRARGILPDYDAVIIDEAHALERAADENLGDDVSQLAVRRVLDRLYRPRADSGLFADSEFSAIQESVLQASRTADAFFDRVRGWMHSREDTQRIRNPGFVTDDLSPVLETLATDAGAARKAGGDPDWTLEADGACELLGSVARRLRAVVQEHEEGRAYWAERRGRRGSLISLRSAPIRAGDLLRPLLFDKVRATVLTSATLSTGGSKPFAYFTDRYGVPEPDTRVFPSPFSYKDQVRLVIARSMPDPNSEEFSFAVAEKVRALLERSGGRAFVLFTSYSLLREVEKELRSYLDEVPFPVYAQGRDLPRTQLLEKFRAEVDSVLFGTASFWEGVDVRGESLSTVIITRLPFAVPTHPLVQARMEKIKSEGGNPFLVYTVPEAVIRLKQGFGRLIRTSTDEGCVAILDRRILTKFYGKTFLTALPECDMRVE